MFGLRKTNNPYAQPAHAVYGTCLEHVREPRFYTEFGVPDTLEGRFDLLLLHSFLVINRVLEGAGEESQEFNQALFDATFADMDQMLRTAGIGDMGVPKRMKKMMLAFNGRMHAYDAALKSDDIETPLRNNLYSSAAEISDAHVAMMKDYVLNNIKSLKADGVLERILQGDVSFTIKD
jgi:cytochrome b pre-mRNA-processing protein 3